MTTDAKIGLLLALVFIVAITFVINGLPAFLSKSNKDADTTAYVNHYKGQQPAIVGQSRNIAPALSHRPVPSVIQQTPEMDVNSPAENRYQAIMPAAEQAVKSTEAIDTNAVQEVAAVKPAAKPGETEIPSSAITYVVSPGDSLAEISQKMYGPELGKKQSSIDKIYNANKDKLSSIHDIQVGQKLVIPDIEDKSNKLVKTGLFEKVSEKLSKITSPQTAKASLVKETPKEAPKETTKTATKEYKTYVIKESDSLWQIAQKQLGNGNRFKEILQLNPSIDADKLEVGTKLKLPAR